MEEQYFATLAPDEITTKLVSRCEEYARHELTSQIDNRVYRAWRYYFGFSSTGFHSTSVVARGGDEGELAEIRVNHSRALVNAMLNLITAAPFSWQPRAANIDYSSVRQTELAASVLEHYWSNNKVSALATQAVESAIYQSEGFILLEWDPHMGARVDSVDAEPTEAPSSSPPPPDVAPPGISTPPGASASPPGAPPQAAAPDDLPADGPQPMPQPKVVRTGDIRFSLIHPCDVIRDPAKRSWEELDWVIVKVWRNKYDIAARFPDVAEDVLQCTSSSDPTMWNRADHNRTWKSDDIPVFHFYHKPCAVLPFGRELVFLGNSTVLEDGNLSFDAIPLVRCSPAELVGTPFGYTSFYEILGLQELTDTIHSSIATNITTFATQCIALPEGSSTQVDEIAGGMKVIYYDANVNGGKPPEPLQLVKSPPEAYNYLEILKASQELLMGMNAVVRGEAPSDKSSGSAMAILQSQAMQQSSTLQGSYKRMLETIGTLILRIIKTKASAPLKIGIVGSHKLDLISETTVDKDGVAGVDQVYVELGNPMAQTAAGRFELAQQMIQMGMVKSPDQLTQVLETGRLDPLTQRDSEETLNILRENQDLAKGTPCVAMIHDNHMLHGREHPSVAANPSARRDVNVINAYTQHMHQHYSLLFGVPLELVPQDPVYRERMLLLTGQQPPPVIMPQPGDPGMPGPLQAMMQGAPPPGGPPPGPPGPPPGSPGVPHQPGPAPAKPSGPAQAPTGAAAATGPKMPSQPVNKATGERWNPVDAGGAVPGRNT